MVQQFSCPHIAYDSWLGSSAGSASDSRSLLMCTLGNDRCRLWSLFSCDPVGDPASSVGLGQSQLFRDIWGISQESGTFLCV